MVSPPTIAMKKSWEGSPRVILPAIVRLPSTMRITFLPPDIVMFLFIVKFPSLLYHSYPSVSALAPERFEMVEPPMDVTKIRVGINV